MNLMPHPTELPFLGQAQSFFPNFFGILLNKTGRTSAWSGFSNRCDKRFGPIGGLVSHCSKSYSIRASLPGSEGHCWMLTISLRKISNYVFELAYTELTVERQTTYLDKVYG